MLLGHAAVPLDVGSSLRCQQLLPLCFGLALLRWLEFKLLFDITYGYKLVLPLNCVLLNFLLHLEITFSEILNQSPWILDCLEFLFFNLELLLEFGLDQHHFSLYFQIFLLLVNLQLILEVFAPGFRVLLELSNLDVIFDDLPLLLGLEHQLLVLLLASVFLMEYTFWNLKVFLYLLFPLIKLVFQLILQILPLLEDSPFFVSIFLNQMILDLLQEV